MICVLLWISLYMTARFILLLSARSCSSLQRFRWLPIRGFFGAAWKALYGLPLFLGHAFLSLRIVLCTALAIKLFLPHGLCTCVFPCLDHLSTGIHVSSLFRPLHRWSPPRGFSVKQHLGISPFPLTRLKHLALTQQVDLCTEAGKMKIQNI